MKTEPLFHAGTLIVERCESRQVQKVEMRTFIGLVEALARLDVGNGAEMVRWYQ